MSARVATLGSTARDGAALHSCSAHDPGPESAPASAASAGPVRTCVGCRTRSQAGVLLRVVVVDGVLTPDPRRRLPGRGAWLHPVRACLERADRRKVFPRALRVAGPLAVDAVAAYVDEHEGARETPGSDTSESKVDPS